MFFPGIIPLRKCSMWAAAQVRKTEWERVRGGQTVCQGASHAIIHPDSQTDNMPCYCSPSRWKRSASHSTVSVCLPETLLKRNNYWVRASGGLCCWLSNRRYSVVTGSCCLSEDLSFTWTKNILLASLSWKFSNSKTLWFADLKYFTCVKLCLPRGL